MGLALLFTINVSLAFEGEHHKHGKKPQDRNQNVDCTYDNLGCAKVFTVKSSPSGDIWRLWVHEQSMYFDISKDHGRSYSQPKRVAIPKEKISARNENRPKLGFDSERGVYLSWASPREKKYTADIRFSYSTDYGQSFSTPVTVNDDNLLTSHSFNEMFVNESGEVQLVWLDGRHNVQSERHGKKVNGSALYYAKATPKQLTANGGNTSFNNQMLANGTCVCCRLAIANNANNNLAVFWRHIYGDNIREFALLTLNEQPAPTQISDDYWQINGCPHQGGGISISDDNRYHMVWFNQGQKGKGVFYSYAKSKGKLLRTPLSIGKASNRATHPHVLATKSRVDIVWLEYQQGKHELWQQVSNDGGVSFTAAKRIATASNGADRPFLFRNGEHHFVSWQRYGAEPIVKVL